MDILIPVAQTSPIQVCAPLIKRESTMASINDCCSSAESSFSNTHPCGKFGSIHPKQTGQVTLTEESLARRMYHCRVCLEESEYSLLTPCKCKSQIHEACLLLWITHRAEQNEEANEFQCEICLQGYQLDFNYQRSFSWEALKESYENDFLELIKLFGTFVLFLSIVIAMGITLVRVCLEQMEFAEFVESYHLDRFTLTIILLSGLTGFSLLCALTGYKLIQHHCLKGQIVILRE